MLAGRFLKFSKGRTSGEAALSAHNEAREAFRVQVLNDFDYLIERRKTAVLPAGTEHTIAAARIHMTYREAYARLSDIG